MKKITLGLILFMACISTGYSQVASYTFSQSNDAFSEITGGTVVGTPTANTVAGSLDSYVTSALSLPFSFTYNSISVSTVYMSSNGFLSLGATAPSMYTTTPISTTSTADGIVSAWSGDLNTFFNLGSRTGNMRWETVGTAPNREIVFQWKDFRPNYSTSTTSAYGFDFQVRLIENGSLVKIVYGPGSFAVGSTAVTGSSNRQIGLRGTLTSDYNNRVFTTFATASTAGVSNSAANSFSTATNFPGNGLTLTWTPPVLCTGTPTAGSLTPASQNICAGSTPANLVASGYSSGVSGLAFQWEESDDNGVGDAWENVTTGTGGTTPTFTPPAFSGTTIYYRLNVTCTGSGLSAQTASVVVNPPIAPTTQVTNLAQGSATLTQIPLNWVNGNGNRRVVYFNSDNSFSDPVDGTTGAITAAAAYAGGEQIVYDGTGTSVTVTGLTAGTTYYAKVYEYRRCGTDPYDYYYNITVGTNVATVSTVDVPVNDDFANASTITCGDTYNGSTVAATLDEDNAPDGFGTDMDAPNVWYSYTGGGTPETVTLDLCGSAYDSSVLVYTGSSGALTLVAANDDDASCSGGSTRSRVSFTSDGTTTYYIAIEGWNAGNTGAFTMVTSCVPACTPAVANQICDTALAITTLDGSDVGSDNSCGDISSVQPSCDSFGTIQDVWFSFVGPANGIIDCVVTPGTMTSANFAIYTGADCSSLSLVSGACNSNLTSATTESLTGLVDGQTYYVQVWSSTAEQGTFTISLNSPNVTPPANDDCSGAVALVPGGDFAAGEVIGSNVWASASQNADPSIPAPGCASYAGGDVWYSAVVPPSGSLTFEVNTDTNGITDGAGAVYSGSCGALVLVSCNDSSSNDPEDQPLISVTGRTAGETLYFRVWEFGNNEFGTFKVSAYDASLSSDSFDLKGFKAYPNPVKDVFKVSYIKEISSVSVHNLLGQEIINQKVNALASEINMSALSRGTYLVKVTVDGLVNTIKVIKE